MTNSFGSHEDREGRQGGIERERGGGGIDEEEQGGEMDGGMECE